MIGESVAIVIVLFVSIVMSLRARNKPLAKLTLPFLLMPLIYLIGEGFIGTAAAGLDDAYVMRLIGVGAGALSSIGVSFLMANINKEVVAASTLKVYRIFAPICCAALSLAYFLRLR